MPITAALRQVTVKGIACTIERIERYVSIYIVTRAGARLGKTIERAEGWGLRFGAATLIGGGRGPAPVGSGPIPGGGGGCTNKRV